MGACIGKKSSKHRTHQQPPSDIIQAPQPKVQDDTSGNKSSPTPSKKLPVTDDGLLVNNDDELRLSMLDETSIDPEIQIIIDPEFQNIIDEQQIIYEPFSRPFPSRVISTTDSELEYELAKLIFEQSEHECIDLPLIANTVKFDDT